MLLPMTHHDHRMPMERTKACAARGPRMPDEAPL